MLDFQGVILKDIRRLAFQAYEMENPVQAFRLEAAAPPPPTTAAPPVPVRGGRGKRQAVVAEVQSETPRSGDEQPRRSVRKRGKS